MGRGGVKTHYVQLSEVIMKLVVKHNVAEGEAYPRDAIFAFGAACDGWYVLFRSPFVRSMQYADANIFEIKQGPCRKVFMVRYRPKTAKRGRIIATLKHHAPIEG